MASRKPAKKVKKQGFEDCYIDSCGNKTVHACDGKSRFGACRSHLESWVRDYPAEAIEKGAGVPEVRISRNGMYPVEKPLLIGIQIKYKIIVYLHISRDDLEVILDLLQRDGRHEDITSFFRGRKNPDPLAPFSFEDKVEVSFTHWSGFYSSPWTETGIVIGIYDRCLRGKETFQASYYVEFPEVSMDVSRDLPGKWEGDKVFSMYLEDILPEGVIL